jgi:hypothetical protein
MNKIQNEELRNLYFSQNIVSDQTEELGIGELCSKHRNGFTYTQKFGPETQRKRIW